MYKNNKETKIKQKKLSAFIITELLFQNRTAKTDKYIPYTVKPQIATFSTL